MNHSATIQEFHSWPFSVHQTPKPVTLAQIPFTRKLFPQSVPKKSLRRQADGWGGLTELGFSWSCFSPGRRYLCWAEGIYACIGLSPAVSPPVLTHKGVPPRSKNTITHWLPENGVCHQWPSWEEMMFSRWSRTGVCMNSQPLLQHAKTFRSSRQTKSQPGKGRWAKSYLL